MSTAEIREKLHLYIDAADDRKVEAMYTMVEDEIEGNYDHWDDEDFVEEMTNRENSYLDGTMKTYTLEESINRAKEALKNR